MSQFQHQPPRWADRFLEWFCHPDLLEEIQGDAYELFYKRAEEKSPKAAKWHFAWDVLRSFRLSTIRNINLYPMMFKSNFKIAVRQIKRQKFYSAINITGLALGIACCLLIALFIKDEMSYDQQHPNVENLYRVALDVNMNEWTTIGNAIPPSLTKLMVEQIPEVTNAARLNPYFENAGTNIVRRAEVKENNFEENFVYVDQSFFELFDLPLIYGDKNSILNEPNTMVITDRMAQKYFPNQNPVGQTLILHNDENEWFKVTGVTKNIPDQTHFNFDFFMSMPTLKDSENTTLVANNYYGYVTLKEGTQPEDLIQKLYGFSMKNFAPQFKKIQNLDFAALEKQGQYYKVCLQPVTDIHLYSEGRTPLLGKAGDIRYVRLFALIALFIFLIALINFINLSTARSANRAKEVGVRKVLGSMKGQLVSQFLMESVLMSVLAFLVGSVLASWLIPIFNDISGKNLSIPFTDWTFFPMFFGIAIVVGMLAGLYPSFYLSAFRPVKVLKGQLSRGAKSGWLRNGLVVGQFAVSIGLIIGTIVVYQQMNFVQNKKMGFDKEQILLIQDTYTLDKQLPTFKKALKEIPEVKNATMSSYLPLDGGRRNSMAFNTVADETRSDQLYMQAWAVDENYINTLGIKLKTGRNFRENTPTDKYSVILNEKAVQEFGLTDPIGKKINSPFSEGDYTIIGVVEDFNYESLRGEIRGLGLFLSESNSVISIKANTADLENLISKTEKLWKSFAPTQPFRYAFLDDRFDKMYTTEQQVSKLFTTFAILAIFIACLGLFAMATFMTEQRTKEIGIRKILGASVPNIVFQLSKNFLLLVVFGLFVAAPIAWFQMNKWLENFAYRIEIEWWIFAIAGFFVVILAFLVVGFQSVKAALANPINSLKVE